jgi:prophage regulatory protein
MTIPRKASGRSMSTDDASSHDQAAIASQPSRLITKAELRTIVPYTPQHILRLEKQGVFPRRVRLGANRVAWLLCEIEEWVEARVAERDTVIR